MGSLRLDLTGGGNGIVDTAGKYDCQWLHFRAKLHHRQYGPDGDHQRTLGNARADRTGDLHGNVYRCKLQLQHAESGGYHLEPRRNR